jgi:hypothetical protein
MIEINESISEFWRWFKAHRADIDALTDSYAPFWDSVLNQLQRLDKHLRFELSEPDGGRREFIVTAEGHTDAFPVVDALVAQAPRIRGWKFIALKPAMGFDFSITFEGIRFDPREMWFLPLASSSFSQDLGLRIAVPNLTNSIKRKAKHAVAIILDTALGERAAALDIQQVEVCAMPEHPESDQYIALHQLPEFIKWRKSKRSGP